MGMDSVNALDKFAVASFVFALIALALVAMNTPQLAFIKHPFYMLSVGFWLIALRWVMAFPESANIWARQVVVSAYGYYFIDSSMGRFSGFTSSFAVVVMYVFVWCGAQIQARILRAESLANIN
jgi:hypothetical protein